MIDLEDRVTARLHARVADIAVEPDLDDVVARAGAISPAGRVSRRVALGAAASLVAVAVGGLVVIGGRTDESRMPFGEAPPVDDDSFYPVIDEEFLSAELRGQLAGSTAIGAEDESWTGVVGVQGQGEVHELISVTAWPAGSGDPIPEAEPTRRDDVREVDNGDSTTLVWEVDGQPFTMVGDNRNTMYELVDVVGSTNEPTNRAGYVFTGPLPEGLSELTTPATPVSGPRPVLSTGDGRLNIEVSGESPLVVFAASGYTEITGDNGVYAADPPGPGALVATRITESETLVVDTRTYDLPELLVISGHIRFVDEATWREIYHVDFECTGCDEMLTGPPVTPPTAD